MTVQTDQITLINNLLDKAGLLDEKEAVSFLGVHRDYLRRLRNEGWLMPVAKLGHVWMYSRESLIQYRTTHPRVGTFRSRTQR